MAKSKSSEPPVLELFDDQPIVITGQPGRLRGSVRLSNTSDKPVLLRSMPLVAGKEQQAFFRTASAAGGPAIRLRPGVIRPGHQGPVDLSLSLDPYTPPGEYHIQAEISGQVRPVVVHVTERIALHVSPREVVVENQPGVKIRKRVVLENRGNVPLQIGEFGVVFLDDDLLICRTLRAAAASVDDDLRSLDEYLATILLSAKHVAESSGALRIHSLSGNFELLPGETRPVDLDVRVPESLDKRGRYRGTLALYTADLSFVIVPGSGPPAPEVRQTPVKKTASKAAGSGKKEEQL